MGYTVFLGTNNCTRAVRMFFGVLLIVFLAKEKALAQHEGQDLDVISKWMGFSDAENSLYHYYVDQADKLISKRKAAIAALHTLADWQKRQEQVRKTLLDIVGPFPQKTPLHPKITGTVDKGDYRVENILYESQPGFYVTSSLFIPANLKGKAPVVIYCSGHSADGYRNTVYQHVIINLVKKGFIVFAFDPVGQGERLEYYDQHAGKPDTFDPTVEHSYPGAQAFLAGSSEARYMIWDGIRAVDYVLSRKEVDPSRIGITGRSGGGTQSAYIAAMDNRIYAAAPECYITNFTKLFHSIGPQDAEQDLVNEIEQGIDHADFLSVRAPKPTLMITTTRDMFSIQGAMETEKEVARIFRAYNKADNFGRVEDDSVHASTEKNRVAMYSFFQKHLGNPGDPEDLKVEILSSNELQVTGTGQVSTSLKGETVFSLNIKDTEKSAAALQASRKDIGKHIPVVLHAAKEISGYHEPLTGQEPVFTGRIRRNGYAVEKYYVKSEGDYVIPYLLMVPERSNHKALIYLHPSGKSAEALDGGEMEWFVQQGFTVLAPDLIGIGETGPGDFHGDAFIKNVSYNVWFASILIHRSIVGLRAGDVVRLARLLKKNAMINEVYGLARKELCPVLLHAAAFEPSISRVALVEPYSSYESIAMNRFYDPRLIYSGVAGAMKFYDLPDLAATIAPRKLMMADIKDGTGKAIDAGTANKNLSIVKSAYNDKKAVGQLTIVMEPVVNSIDLFREWIK